MEFDNNIPIYLQVIGDIKKNIVKGNLHLGDKLPSARELALKYKINPNTASRIYKELEASEICYTKRGLGTYVAENPEMIGKMKEEMASNLIESFFIGMKDLNYTKEELIDLIMNHYKLETTNEK